jgi:hypothetical protein
MKCWQESILNTGNWDKTTQNPVKFCVILNLIWIELAIACWQPANLFKREIVGLERAEMM